MAIKLFLSMLLVVSVIFLSTTITNSKKFIPNVAKEKPNIIFLDSIMYELDNNGVSQIIRSLKAYHYDKKDKLFNATLTLRSQNTQQPYTIRAKYLLKKQDKLTFKDDVVLVDNNNYKLTTSYLDYDMQNMIAKNEHKFKLFIKRDTLFGNSLYFDANLGIIKAKDTIFKIETKQ
jgi:LPS export ABC transporter protein LptC